MEYSIKKFINIKQAKIYSKKYLADYGYTPEIFKTRKKGTKKWAYEIVKPKTLKKL